MQILLKEPTLWRCNSYAVINDTNYRLNVAWVFYWNDYSYE